MSVPSLVSNEATQTVEENGSACLDTYKISDLARRMCLLLACSRTNKVPAFIFFRPCFSQKRWTSSGDLKLVTPNDGKSEFKALLHKSITSRKIPDSPQFPSSAIGWFAPPTEISAGLLREGMPHALPLVPCPIWCFNEDLQSLLKNGCLTRSSRDNLLYLSLDPRLKAKIRAECEAAHLLQATLDLVKLVIWSLPDPYSEPLWELLSMHCRDLIHTTVLPFFSVVSGNESIGLSLDNLSADDIHRLGLHSIYQGVYVEECKLSQTLTPEERNREVGKMLDFHEEAMRYLSDPEMKQAENIVSIIKATQPSILTMVGLALDAFLGFEPRFPDQVKLFDIIHLWAEQAHDDISPLTTVLHTILSRQSSQGYSNLGLDLLPDIKASLGCGLARRRKFDFATSLLEDALLKFRGSFRLIEFGYLSAELVKCFNALQEDEKGELFGENALALLTMKGSELKLRTDLAYLTIAVGDSLIGQGRYDEAKTMLTTVLKNEELLPRLATVTALRMNKVNRRLLLKDGCTLALASPLGTALSSVGEAETELKLECITEISATIAQLELDSQGDIFANHDVQNFFRATVETFSKDKMLVEDWRMEAVNAHLSEKKHTFTPERIPSLHIAPDQEDRTEGISTNSSQEARSPTVNKSWEQKSALTFDSGGIRSYASLLILKDLMVEIGKIELSYPEAHTTSFYPFEQPEQPLSTKPRSLDESFLIDFLPCHYFDYIVGTGTGGIVAIFLSRLRMSVKECLKNFESMASMIFEHERRISIVGFPRAKYSKHTLERAIEIIISGKTPIHSISEALPKFKMLPSPSDLCRTIVLAVQQAKSTRGLGEIPLKGTRESPYLFRSYEIRGFGVDNPPRNCGVDINHTIKVVCRATTAAPTFFDALKIGDDEFYSGGIGTENPTSEALEEIFRLHQTFPRILASFGAGMSSSPRLFRRTNEKLNLLNALDRVNGFRIALRSALTDCEVTHQNVRELARRFDGSPNSFHYHRFNVEEGLGSVPLDECKTARDDGDGGKCSTFDYIAKRTRYELAKPLVRERLRKLASHLVEQRRRRISNDSDRWERFACCTVYACSEDECSIDGEFIRFNLRREMREHLQKTHGLPEGVGGPEVEWKLDQCRRLPDYPGGPF